MSLVSGLHLSILRGMEQRVPLRRSPSVSQIGLNVHGRLARERFRMPGLWGLHLYHYAGELEIAGRRFAFSPGCVSVTPPDSDLVWRFPAHAPHHFALLSFPGAREEDRVPVPVITDLGGSVAGHAEALRIDQAVASFAREPQRANAWAWDLMWRLVPVVIRGPAVSGVPGAEDRTVPPALQVILTMLNLELDQAHSLTGLARRAGISANHLLRLFRRHCGDTVMGWIRRRRGERAHELLVSTNLPIRDIALAVGCPDLHAFNRLIRQTCGASPRRVRNGSRV